MERRPEIRSTRSRRLPPPEAWKDPSRWINVSTGLVKPGIEKIVLPTDDRTLLRPDQVVEIVNDQFFWPDYDWPYDAQDPETAPDDHHFYFTAASYHPRLHGDSLVPRRFRELPTHVGWMPRQFHNAIHDLTATPAVPEIDVMEDHYQAYLLAYQSFKRLIDAARKTSRVSAEIGQRHRAITRGHVIPSQGEDIVAEEFYRSFFARHFEEYSRTVEDWQSLPPSDRALLGLPELTRYKPHDVVRKLGGAASRRHLNFVTVLKAA